MADWFAILLRWLCILGLTVGLSFANDLNMVFGSVMFLVVIWNCYMTILAVSNRRMAGHRYINIVVDGICMVVLYILSKGVSGSIAWVSLLVLSSSAIYFKLWGSLLTALTFSLIQIGIDGLSGSLVYSPIPAFILIGFNLVVGLVLGLISQNLIENLRRTYFSQIRQREEDELKAKKQERDRLQAFYELTATLSSTLNYQTVLNTALDMGARVMDDDSGSADKTVSAVLLFEENHLKVASTRRMGANDQRINLPGTTGLIATALNNSEPVIGNDPGTDPELGRFTSLHNCKSVVIHALRSGMNVYGVILFAHPTSGHFTPDRYQVLEVMNRQAVVAIQNSLLYQALEQEKERIIDTQEEARKKLARDLHDGPTQSVAAIAMRINFTRRLLESNPKDVPEELAKIEELARRTTKEIRHMLFTLRPLVLESQGLLAALLAMAEKMKETFGQEVLVEVEEAVIHQLEIGKQTVVFYLAEEAVNNARKHAQASHIWVRLRSLKKEKEIALLEIQDNGLGFDVEAVKSNYDGRGSLGMINLRERTELINGLLHIQSALGQGTQVQVFIPLSEEAADRLHRDV
jgi:signal transduction histidine kinase